jgi:hypothetical protein
MHAETGRVLAMITKGVLSGSAAVAVLLAVLLSGCSSSVVERSYDGLPTDSSSATPVPGELPEPDFGPQVQWSDGGRLLALSLFGSSTCPLKPSGMTQVGDDHLKISLEKTGGPQCTADLRPVTHELIVPPSVTKSAPVTVEVSGHEFNLPARRTP